MVVNVEKMTCNACFVQEASKNFLSQGYLTWVGRVTGNDNVFLVGQTHLLAPSKLAFWATIIVHVAQLYGNTILIRRTISDLTGNFSSQPAVQHYRSVSDLFSHKADFHPHNLFVQKDIIEEPER